MQQQCLQWLLLASVLIASEQQKDVSRSRHSRGPDTSKWLPWQTTEKRAVHHESTKRENIIQVPNSKLRNSNRDHRLLSLFTLVRFENNVCIGISGENGTCISPTECAQRGGLSSGLCANGYGVCCIVYIDVGTGPTNPVMLSFVTSGSGFDRSWRVRIAQIPCSSIFRAEEGCMQYFTGVSGQVKSFNYDPNIGLQLSNQDYSICIRMERNFCGIQYMTCDDGVTTYQTNPITNPSSVQSFGSFTLSGNTLNGQTTAMSDRSCQNDWLMIPCAANAGRLPGSQVPCVDRFCGGAFNTDPSVNSTSIISTSKPFRMIFHTDGTEAPNDYGNRGFCLNYVQQPCTMKLR